MSPALAAVYYSTGPGQSVVQQFTSYAGCEGTWSLGVRPGDGPGVFPASLASTQRSDLLTGGDAALIDHRWD